MEGVAEHLKNNWYIYLIITLILLWIIKNLQMKRERDVQLIIEEERLTYQKQLASVILSNPGDLTEQEQTDIVQELGSKVYHQQEITYLEKYLRSRKVPV